MYTDTQLNRDAECRDALTLDRLDNAAARQDYHNARVEEVRAPLERRMVRYPTTDEFAQAMANVLPIDVEFVALVWRGAYRGVDFEHAMRNLLAAELRKMADTAAEEQVQREERELEGEVRRVRRVKLGDEL